MSKLRDRIRDLGRRRSTPFGFATARTAAAPTSQMLVIAEAADAAAAGKAVTDGVDAIIYTGAAAAIAAAVTAAGSVPVGARLDNADAATAEAVRTAGADFLVFDAGAAGAGAIRNPNLGYVALGAALTDDGLRLLRLLELDAVLVLPPSGGMTVRQQLEMRRRGELARKPLLALLDASASTPDTDQLEAWRDAGIVGVVAPGGAIAALAAAAAAVPEPREVPGSRREAILPAVTASSFDDEDEH